MSNGKGYNNVIGLLDAFPDEAACAQHLASIRWPSGPVCLLCGGTEKVYRMKRPGIYKCGACRKEFSIRRGTVYEESRLPLRKWFLAAFLMTTSRKGISSHQLAREIGTTQKTAWFVLGRLRKASEQASTIAGTMPGPVESDTAFFGGREQNKHASKKLHAGRGPVGKMAVVNVRSRVTGEVSAAKIERDDTEHLADFLLDRVAYDEVLYTDEARAYQPLRGLFQHETVNHSIGEYVRGEASTNGAESFWAMLRRGYVGVFHQLSWRHLHRYLAEFSHRWNMLDLSSSQRVDAILKAGIGERLTYEELTE